MRELLKDKKKEYLLNTWGGFYNKEYQKEHKKVEGYHYFDTEKERADCLTKLKKIEKKMKAFHLVSRLSDGYNTRIITRLHRVIKFKGKEYYSTCKLSPNYPYSVAKYCLEYTWCPGHNDYPLGKDFDYDKVNIIQEWITGAFDITDVD